MSILARGRRRSTFAGADDAVLFAAVAGLNVEAVEETYKRHAAVLCGLALLTVEHPELAKDAVAGAFITLWRASSSISLEEQSLRAALAGEVYTRCRKARQKHECEPRQRARSYRTSQPSAQTGLALLPHSQRDLLALILLGEHNLRQAARRVGLSEAIAALMVTDTMRTTRRIDGIITVQDADCVHDLSRSG
jgi:DNA-directed RNA polymerase specialized sigma24 family protein